MNEHNYHCPCPTAHEPRQQNTLSDEIERVIEEFDNLLDDLTDGIKLEKMAEHFGVPVSVVAARAFSEIGKDFIEQMANSIAEKTVEAVRVEKDPVILRQDGVSYYFDAVEGYNQAITEQSKLASRWLGKEEV